MPGLRTTHHFGNYGLEEFDSDKPSGWFGLAHRSARAVPGTRNPELLNMSDAGQEL
jgi:hypothetical protein